LSAANLIAYITVFSAVGTSKFVLWFIGLKWFCRISRTTLILNIVTAYVLSEIFYVSAHVLLEIF
jgi:hypothetical protein